jgi:hypothetical protein
MAVVFKICPLFKDSFAEVAANNPKLVNRFEEFKKFKSQNPLASFGSNDLPLVGQGHFAKAVPGIKHAHLSHDVSVWYTISGRDPTEIKLYGVFTHKDTGTSRPPNLKKQMAVASRLANQSFS